MLALSAWTSCVNKKPSILIFAKKKPSIMVFAKLGGKLLGRVIRPCRKDVLVKPYEVLRKLQEQVGLFYKHTKRPSRYIVLCLGSTRLTPPGFAFRQTLDLVLDVLCAAERLDVFYDEDDSFALESLDRAQLEPSVHSDANYGINSECPRLTVFDRSTVSTCQDSLVLPELEVFTFRHEKITTLDLYHNATSLGNIAMFPDVKVLTNTGTLCQVDFASLYKLERLKIRLEASVACSLANIGVMRSLVYLQLDLYQKSVRTELPSCVGLMTNLESLSIEGRPLCGHIPSELGKLHKLQKLRLVDSDLTGSIPSQLGQLDELAVLALWGNKKLSGKLPSQLGLLAKLDKIDLFNTMVDYQGVMPCGEWTPYKKYMRHAR